MPISRNFCVEFFSPPLRLCNRVPDMQLPYETLPSVILRFIVPASNQLKQTSFRGGCGRVKPRNQVADNHKQNPLAKQDKTTSC